MNTDANAKCRADGLLAIGRDLITEPAWKYEESPPFQLSQLTKLDLLEATDSELSRVIWFWCRRPKLMFHDSAALMVVALCVLISLFIVWVNWHLTSVPRRAVEVIIMLSEVAVEIWVIVNRRRFLRWRREYELSVDRLIQAICQ